MKTHLTGAAAVAIAASGLALALPASAQSTSIAVIDPAAAIFNAKALGVAGASIGTQFKADFDRASARQRTLNAAVQPLLAKLDSNSDKKIDDAELQAAQAAKRPELQQIQTLRETAEREISTIIQPSNLAQAYVIDQIRLKYRPALEKAATARRATLVLTNDTTAYAQPAVDITQAVTAEIDTALPTASTTPPAGWQPSQETVQLFQQYEQLVQLAAQRQQAQGAPAPGAAPAAPATQQKPQGR